MPAAIVQARTVFSGGSNTSSFGIVLGATPTPGNLLIACVTAFQGFASVGSDWTDSGITVTDANSGVNKILYRYVPAASPADDATYSFGSPNNASFWTASVVEVSGVTGVWADDLGVSQTGTAASGTNPFTTTAVNTLRDDALALAFVECPQAGSPNGGFDGAWTQQAVNTGGGYGAGVASRSVPADGTSVQTSVTWSRSFTAAYIVLTVEPEFAVAESRVTQTTAIVGTLNDGESRITQSVAIVGTRIAAPSRITQSVAIVGVKLDNPGCDTAEADLWRIERTDGTVYRFTSHDRRMTFRGETYEPCGSLSASALQLSAEIGSTDNVDLSGVIYDGGITELDLWSGRFVGADVQIWRVSWADAETAVLVTSGVVGNAKFADQPFTFEIVTAGERLTQRALLQPVMPTCRFKTFDGRCGLDAADFVVTGSVTALAAKNLFSGNARRAFFDSSRSEADDYFTRGKITFTSGDNNGQSADVKSYVQSGGGFVLESRLAYSIKLGDTYSLLPGDDHSFETCRDKFDNAINFGGFPAVKGNDDLNTDGRPDGSGLNIKNVVNNILGDS